MEEDKIVKIEEEISRDLEGKIKNVDSKDSKKIIEEGIRGKNYLQEDWQVGYAVQRIVEKIEEYRKKQRLLKGDKAPDEKSNLVIAYTAPDKTTAMLVKSLLEAEKIKTLIMANPGPEGVFLGAYGCSAPFNPWLVYVSAKQLAEAKDLLNQLENK